MSSTGFPVFRENTRPSLVAYRFRRAGIGLIPMASSSCIVAGGPLGITGLLVFSLLAGTFFTVTVACAFFRSGVRSTSSSQSRFGFTLVRIILVGTQGVEGGGSCFVGIRECFQLPSIKILAHKFSGQCILLAVDIMHREPRGGIPNPPSFLEYFALPSFGFVVACNF